MTASQKANDLLETLRTVDPWSWEGIDRATKRMDELWKMADDPVAAMTPEDAVNYYAAEVHAMIINLLDVLPCSFEEYVETLRWQHEALEVM